MYRRSLTLAASSAALILSAVSASAGSGHHCGWLSSRFGAKCGGHGGGSRVPEIDASTGLLALAAVGAALALAWELKRRRTNAN